MILVNINIMIFKKLSAYTHLLFLSCIKIISYMNIFKFTELFPDEQSCSTYLKKQREQQGITCKKCQASKHYWIESKQLWKCASCGSWTNLKAGTIMTKSKLSIRTWFLCIHLMTTLKKSISALEMQRQLGIKRYEPVWYMMQKIRLSMGKRDKKYKLNGTIEMDDAFFEIVDIKDTNNDTEPQEQKRGRGSQRQSKVLVMVESQPNPKQQLHYKKDRIMGFVKMVVMDDLTTNSIAYETQKNIQKSSTVISDAYPALNAVKHHVQKHEAIVVPKKEAHKKLPWVHTTISNAKRQFLGVHHSINRKYLQNYLNEFCWKLNRRTFTTDLFDRMITAGASDTWY